MKTIAVIPARYASTRMPGKPLADVLGKPMIWWVYQAAKACPKLDGVLIATDDERIADACKTYGMRYLMTSSDHDTPTGRIWEVSTVEDADLYLQLMGDEPEGRHQCGAGDPAHLPQPHPLPERHPRLRVREGHRHPAVQQAGAGVLPRHPQIHPGKSRRERYDALYRERPQGPCHRKPLQDRQRGHPQGSGPCQHDFKGETAWLL